VITTTIEKQHISHFLSTEFCYITNTWNIHTDKTKNKFGEMPTIDWKIQ